MLTFFKWYQEWLIDCDYEPSQQQKEAMEDAWNGALLTANEAAQQIARLTRFPQCKGCEYNPCDLENNSGIIAPHAGNTDCSAALRVWYNTGKE